MSTRPKIAQIKNVVHRQRGTRGFTLLEVMIATAVTLLMMLSLAVIFKAIGDSMRQGRAALELNSKLRTVAFRLRTDLENITVTPRPPLNQSAGVGYCKIYDGPMTDFTAVESDATLSRFGDLDDILMFTARAGDDWFTGKVPAYVLGGAANDTTPVTIAAQHAEIVVFVEPLVTNVGNPNRDSAVLVADPTQFADADNNGFADSFRLHYRTNLIRPDLNTAITNGNARLPNTQIQLPVSANSVNLPSPLCDMSVVHQLCDLSMRRIIDANDGLAGTMDYVAANSLEDLINPANRFAHVQIPIPNTTAYTMPVLALTPMSGMLAGTGFLHPAFALQTTRVGEDIIAADVTAFDLKAYDSTASVLCTTGADGVNGSSGDDDGDNTTDEADELGYAGSDDTVLTPNDPGYGAVVTTAGIIGSGEYVDIGWGRKTGRTYTANARVNTQLSGLTATGISPFLYKSGQVILANNTPVLSQPAYDTWTSAYETDGTLQAEMTGENGIVWSPPAASLKAVDTWRATAIDGGTDGIDNNPTVSTGVDDPTELETSPPFPVSIRGLKASIRIEAPASRQFSQMTVSKEFVTQ